MSATGEGRLEMLLAKGKRSIRKSGAACTRLLQRGAR
jgi:hypothetical protein